MENKTKIFLTASLMAVIGGIISEDAMDAMDIIPKIGVIITLYGFMLVGYSIRMSDENKEE